MWLPNVTPAAEVKKRACTSARSRTEQCCVASAERFHQCGAFVQVLCNQVGRVTMRGKVPLHTVWVWCIDLHQWCHTFLSKRRTMVGSSSRVLYQAMKGAASTLSSGAAPPGESTILFLLMEALLTPPAATLLQRCAVRCTSLCVSVSSKTLCPAGHYCCNINFQ